MQTPFVKLFNKTEEKIKNILDWDIFVVMEMNKDEEEELKFDAGNFLPNNNDIAYKRLCNNLANDIPSEYFKLFYEYPIDEVYELYAIKLAENYTLKENYKSKNG